MPSGKLLFNFALKYSSTYTGHHNKKKTPHAPSGIGIGDPGVRAVSGHWERTNYSYTLTHRERRREEPGVTNARSYGVSQTTDGICNDRYYFTLR
jgi:hypothetical protein